MLLLTSQSKEVVDIINATGEYFVNTSKSLYYGHNPECYAQLTAKLGGKHSPIFTWAQLQDTEIGLTFAASLGNPIAITRSHWLLLDVPDEYVVLTDYFNYADMMWLKGNTEEEILKEFKGEMPRWDQVYIDKITPKWKYRDIQGILSTIKKEWVVDIKTEEEMKNMENIEILKLHDAIKDTLLDAVQNMTPSERILHPIVGEPYDFNNNIIESERNCDMGLKAVELMVDAMVSSMDSRKQGLQPVLITPNLKSGRALDEAKRFKSIIGDRVKIIGCDNVFNPGASHNDLAAYVYDKYEHIHYLDPAKYSSMDVVNLSSAIKTLIISMVYNNMPIPANVTLDSIIKIKTHKLSKSLKIQGGQIAMVCKFKIYKQIDIHEIVTEFSNAGGKMSSDIIAKQKVQELLFNTIGVKKLASKIIVPDEVVSHEEISEEVDVILGEDAAIAVLPNGTRVDITTGGELYTDWYIIGTDGDIDSTMNYYVSSTKDNSSNDGTFVHHEEITDIK